MEDGDEYWSLLPLYGVARCPYCNAVYTEKMDTYTLRQWIVWGADMESWRSLLTFPPRSDYEDWYDLEPSLCRPLADLHLKNRQQPEHVPVKATIGRPFRNRLSPFSGRAPSCRWPSGAKRKNEPPFSFPYPQPERFVAWRSVFDLPAHIGENRHPLFWLLQKISSAADSV